MKTSRNLIQRALVAFAWSSWAELGVPGWARSHREWCIDPEALMLLTESVGDTEPRLLEEASRWCADHRSLLSRSRWTKLRAGWPVAFDAVQLSELDAASAPRQRAVGRFAAVSNPKRSRTASTPARAAWFGLRLRSAFGPTARAELMRILLLELVDASATASDFALEAACTKRNAADALDMLRDAGLVESIAHGNRLHFELRHRRALEQTFGPLPKTRISFAATARVLAALAHAEQELVDAPATVRSIEARERARLIASDLRRIGMAAPRIAPGQDAWNPLLAWARGLAEGLVSMRTD